MQKILEVQDLYKVYKGKKKEADVNIAYFIIGVIIYKRIERVARKRNLLCQY